MKISIGVVWAFNCHGLTLMLVAADKIKPMRPIHGQIQSKDFSRASQLDDGYDSTVGIDNAATDTMEQQQRKLYGLRTQDVTGKRTQKLVKQNKRIPPLSTPRTRPEHYRPTKDWNSNRGKKKKKQDRKRNKDNDNQAGEQLSRGGSSRQSRNKDGRRGRPSQQTQAIEHTASNKRRKKKDKRATEGV